MRKTEDTIPHLRNVCSIALVDEGETLQLIAAVILGSHLLYDDSAEKELDELTGKIALALPRAKKRMEYLLGQKEARRPPMELAGAVLPFNFR